MTWTRVPPTKRRSWWTGLSNGTLYAFEVRAVSSAGNGVAAGPRNATPRHVLATNVGQHPYHASSATGDQKAQAFTTGSNANGYTLQVDRTRF